MVPDRSPDDWQVLGVAPGSSLEEVFRAYSRRKAIYADNSLASYSLYDHDERAALLARVEEAYERIVAASSDPSGSGGPGDPSPEKPLGPSPTLEERPGAFLRHARLMRQTTLAQLAAETKIRAALLERIESETFSGMPARVYVRGFVIQYAKALDLEDPDRVAEAYLAKLEQAIGS